MAKAGWCDICQANVWLKADGSDEHGHDASHITNVYEADAPAAAGSSEFGEQANKVAGDVGDGLKDAGQQLGAFAKDAWAWGKKQASPDEPPTPGPQDPPAGS
jgi:hypothetical protein